MERYRIEGAREEGGIRLLDCVDTKANRPVLIKELTCADFNDAAKYVHSGIVTAEIAHPNICRMYDLIPVQDAGGLKINVVLEKISLSLVQDLEIRGKADPQRPYTEAEMREFLKQMASALQFAHSKGIAHRDINPEHIFIDENNTYKLSDFGASWRGNATGITTTVQGQLNFMCPIMKKAAIQKQKQADPYKVDKADVYSLGVTVLCMGLLRSPDKLGQPKGHDASAKAYIKELDISPAFAELLEKMTITDEIERYNATNVLEALSTPNALTNIVAVWTGNVSKFDFEEGKDEWVDVPYQGGAPTVNEDSATVIIDSNSLLCCGGGPSPCTLYADNRAFTVKTNNGNVGPAANLRTGRKRHGIIYNYDTDCVFVFGGNGDAGPLRSCEKYPAPRGRPADAWTEQREMQYPRSGINPCMLNGLIYIVGGGHPSVETFDPRFGLFKGCQNLDINPEVGLSVVHQDKLAVVWPGRKGEEEGQDMTPIYSNSPPVVCENAVFVVVMSSSGFDLKKVGIFSAKEIGVWPGN